MTDAPGHLDLDALADVLAGVRDEPHLRSCRRCSDRLAELSAADAAVTAALARLPAPSMPDELSQRLARALQEERRGELAAVRPLRRGRPSWLPAVAASAALVLAGAVGWSLVDLSGSGGQEARTSAAGGSGQDTAADSESAAQPGPESAAEAEPPGPEAAAAPAPRAAGTATDWADEAAREAALSRLLAADGASTTAAPAGDELDRLRDPAALAACLASLPSGQDEVLAVDYAQYAGAPAVAFVQPAGPGQVTVTVVGSGCSAADPQVLDGLSLPRP